jgi:hypothetical protein
LKYDELLIEIEKPSTEKPKKKEDKKETVEDLFDYFDISEDFLI